MIFYDVMLGLTIAVAIFSVSRSEDPVLLCWSLIYLAYRALLHTIDFDGVEYLVYSIGDAFVIWLASRYLVISRAAYFIMISCLAMMIVNFAGWALYELYVSSFYYQIVAGFPFFIVLYGLLSRGGGGYYKRDRVFPWRLGYAVVTRSDFLWSKKANAI